ncbi:hypothetical protein Q3V23_18885 [Streptomyces sp. VNUA116]|uniref:hypothetical protein n=1 Tax=Streptomyces sp. VNUA116 TaxID=3062449 RepID=UPI0026754E3E|nr:hypothetical protein [Streptomyces sp. VNUA116]WKU45956.1 hypothetical protein Q3V23_18885 [Streptomyces sp. VNUA116]
MTTSPINLTDDTTIKITPSIGFLSGLTYTVGIHHGDAGPVAQLLMTHTPPRRPGETLDWIDAGMRALSACLDLRPTTEAPAHVGPRLSVHRGVASLDYGDTEWRMRIPQPGRAWLKHVTDGGPVRLLAAFEPSPSNGTQEQWGQFVDAAAAAGRLRWGTTSIRRPWNLR